MQIREEPDKLFDVEPVAQAHTELTIVVEAVFE